MKFKCISGSDDLRKWSRLVGYVVLIGLLLIVPQFVRDPRWMHLVIMTGLYIILAGGLRLIMSTGQVSFAHAAFWGIGAYTSTLLVMRLGVSFWIALPLSGLVGAIVASLIGYPCLRLKGPYFFLVTMVVGEILRLFLTNSVDFFGGDAGISSIPSPNRIRIGNWAIAFPYRSVNYYYLMLVGLFVSLFVYYRLERSRFGMICSGVRADGSLSESLGVNVMKYKLTAFVVGSLLASLVGSFFAHYTTFISPGFFTFNESTIMLIMVVIGGLESTTGAIIGVILITVLTELTREFSKYEIIVYGAALVLVFRFAPGGIFDLYRKFISRLRSHRASVA